MKRVFVPLTGAVLLLSTFPATAEMYECKLRMKRSGGNWMGPTIYVDYDRETQSATVVDGVLNHHLGEKVSVSRIIENSKKITFVYDVFLSGTSSNRAGNATSKHHYRLSVLKPSLKAVVNMKPLGYSNTFRDDGKCRVR